MPTAESDVDAARRQLNRVLASEGFRRNERLARFLRFVVEQHLGGKDSETKESVIAIEVFGRGADHDPKQTSIVRNEAARLRARLNEYYAGDGKNDSLIIELPKGGYAPALRQPAVAPAVSTLGPERNSLRPGRRLRPLVALAGVALAAGAWGWWRSQNQNAPVAIAVLPLTSLSQDAANDYFADGLTDEIIRNLSIIDGLAVRSQTSSFSFKGKPRQIRDAGKQLEADYILEGSVLRTGQQLRINAQLVRVRDDFPLWSGRYDRDLTDVLAVQDEISGAIVNSLRLKLGRGRRRYEVNAEAYDLYLHLRGLEIQRGLPDLNQSVGPLEQVIAKDPSFAPAHAGLARAHAARSGEFQFDIADEMSKMRVAAEKAIQLDPLLPEANDALGMVHARDAQWEQSEQSFRRAIALDPNRAESYDDFAMYLLLPLGRIEEALQELHIAEKADPLSPEVHYFLYYVLNSAGRDAEASRYCEKLPADHFAKSACLVAAQLREGKIGEVIPTLEAEFNRGVAKGSWVRSSLGCAYSQAGRREDAERIAAVSSFNHFNEAEIFGCLGDKDRTFDALDRAAVVGPVRIGRVLNGRKLALLRGDPRVKALRKKVGLPDLQSR